MTRLSFASYHRLCHMFLKFRRRLRIDQPSSFRIFFNIVAKLGDKRLSGSIFIDVDTEIFSDMCNWGIFRDSLITILLIFVMSLSARNRARNVSGKSIPGHRWTQRINASEPTIFFVERWTFGWKNIWNCLFFSPRRILLSLTALLEILIFYYSNKQI